MPESFLVIGAGPVGTATARHLASHGHDVCVLTRSGTTVDDTRAIRGDASSRADLEAALLSSGADRVIDCMHARYDAAAWRDALVPAEHTVLDVASAHGVHVTFPESVYAFGPEATTVTARSPITATAGKPGIRAQLLRARENSPARVCSVVASDLYGPGCGPGSIAHSLIFNPIHRGRTPMALVSADIAHPYTYLPDYARALAEASINQLESIEVAPTSRPMPQRDIALNAYRTAGKPPRTPFVLSRWMLRAAGLFDSDVRGLVEMTWLWDTPRRVEGSFAWCATEPSAAISATMNWVRASG